MRESVCVCVCTCCCVFSDRLCVFFQSFCFTQQQLFPVLQVAEFSGRGFCGFWGGADPSAAVVCLDTVLRSVSVWTLTAVCVSHDFWIFTIIHLLYEELSARSVFLPMSFFCLLCDLHQDFLRVTQRSVLLIEERHHVDAVSNDMYYGLRPCVCVFT